MTTVHRDEGDTSGELSHPDVTEPAAEVAGLDPSAITTAVTEDAPDGAVDAEGELLTKRQQRLRRRTERKAQRREKRAKRSALNKGIRRGVLVVVGILVVLVGYSFVSALLKSNNDPVAIKAVGWFRDNNLGFIANTAEKWWYSANPPETGGKLKGGIPSAAPSGGDVGLSAAYAQSTLVRPTNIKPFVENPEPNEGVWQKTGKEVDGQPVMYQTFIRPDAKHTGQLVGVAWMNTKKMRAELYNGTEEPGGRDWKNGSRVEPADYGPLIATFNSGFKINGSLGGYYNEGRMVKPLVDGRASMIFKNDGSIDIGEWGRDATMGPDIKAVRQNLSLLIDHGTPAPDLSSNFQSRWGATLGNSLFVWRSGVGIDRNGGLIYVGGPAMSVQTLADVLQAAGAYNAMELDINTVWVSMHTYLGGDNGSEIQSFKLLDEMQRPPSRHLQTGSRDFIAMFAKPAPPLPKAPTTTAAPSLSTTTSKPKK